MLPRWCETAAATAGVFPLKEAARKI